MTKLLTRTITVVVLVPAIFAAILLLPWYHYLVINLTCIVVSVFGAYETAHFFSSRGFPHPQAFVPILGGLIPLATYLEILLGLPGRFVVPAVLIGAAIVLLREVFLARQDHFADILPRIAVSMTVLLYPGLFLSYVIRFSVLPRPGISLVVFLVIVFSNDILAYLAGSMWGRSTSNVLPISPNKSIVGFASGLLGSVLMALVCLVLFPYVFGNSFPLALVVGLCVGVLTIFGDLIESAMKRSSATKDSGSIVPGRGGILDSIDSVLFAGPVCYYLLLLAGTR